MKARPVGKAWMVHPSTYLVLELYGCREAMEMSRVCVTINSGSAREEDNDGEIFMGRGDVGKLAS